MPHFIVKRFFKLMLLSLLFPGVAALAGGPDVLMPPVHVGATRATGVYVSGGVGYGYSDGAALISGPLTTGFTNTNDGFAWLFAAGYKILPNFAVEVGFFKLPKVSTSANILGAFIHAKTKTNSLYIAAKGILPLDDRIDIFVKAGVARMDVNTVVNAGTGGGLSTLAPDNYNLVFMGGVGIDYFIVNGLALTIQAMATLRGSGTEPAAITNIGTPPTTIVTGGLTFQFGV